LDADHHDSPTIQRLVLGYITQGIAMGGFVRSMRDGHWLEAASECASGSKSAAEFLKMLKNRKLLLVAPSCGAPNWFQEALLSHKQRRLTGIVVDDLTGASGSDVLVSTASSLQDASWWIDSPPSIDVARTADELVRVLRLLLSSGREIHIIDRFLNPAEKNYRDTMEAFLRESLNNPYKPEIVYHTSYRAFGRIGAAVDAFQGLSNQLKNHGRRGRVCLWDHDSVKGKFHDRHFVTDVGGCQVGGGFASSPRDITTISLHSDESRRNTLGRFNYDRNRAQGLIDHSPIGAVPNSDKLFPKSEP
jgi:hypothetical protein